MQKLRKYTSFEALKSNEQSGSNVQVKNNNTSEFEAFVKRLQIEYSSKKQNKADDRKRPDQ